jgi:hypothetical protein
MTRRGAPSRSIVFRHDHEELHAAFARWQEWLTGPLGGYPATSAGVYVSTARAVAARVVNGELPPLQALYHTRVSMNVCLPWLMFVAWYTRGSGCSAPLPPGLAPVTAAARTPAGDVLEADGLGAAVRTLWDEELPPHTLAELPLGAVLTPRGDGAHAVVPGRAPRAVRALLKAALWAYGGAPTEQMHRERPAFPRRPWYMDRRGQWIAAEVLWDLAGRAAAPGEADALPSYTEVVDFRAAAPTPADRGTAVHDAMRRKRLAGAALIDAEILDALDFAPRAGGSAALFSDLVTWLGDHIPETTLRLHLSRLLQTNAIVWAGSAENPSIARAGSAFLTPPPPAQNSDAPPPGFVPYDRRHEYVTAADIRRLDREVEPSQSGGWSVHVNVVGVQPLTARDLKNAPPVLVEEDAPPPAEPAPFDAPEIPA